MASIKDLGDLQIKSKIASNWIETKDEFIADNLIIYYRSEFGEWRLRDMNLASSMDITTIKIPLDSEEIIRIKKLCSEYHKSN
jgi:hypothetical protein